MKFFLETENNSKAFTSDCGLHNAYDGADYTFGKATSMLHHSDNVSSRDRKDKITLNKICPNMSSITY